MSEPPLIYVIHGVVSLHSPNLLVISEVHLPVSRSKNIRTKCHSDFKSCPYNVQAVFCTLGTLFKKAQSKICKIAFSLIAVMACDCKRLKALVLSLKLSVTSESLFPLWIGSITSLVAISLHFVCWKHSFLLEFLQFFNTTDYRLYKFLSTYFDFSLIKLVQSVFLLLKLIMMQFFSSKLELWNDQWPWITMFFPAPTKYLFFDHGTTMLHASGRKNTIVQQPWLFKQ